MDRLPTNEINELGVPIGFQVNNWTGAVRPGPNTLAGTYCYCEPLDLAQHADILFSAFHEDRENRIWVYLPYGPFDTPASFRNWMKTDCFTGDPFFYAIIDRNTGIPSGMASYLRITPGDGSIEVGHINYSPALQNTVAATEAMYLMMENVFNLGFRRYEWKCNALNEKSCRAAERLGFTFEGVFRQATVVKGRNRDTAWYSVLDREWPAVKQAHKQWLAADNFDTDGMQRQSLSTLTSLALKRESQKPHQNPMP